jgi:superoxide dismutase, Cu-Zn family
MYKHIYQLGFSLLFVFSTSVTATQTTIYGTDEKHEIKGTITFKNSPGGLLIHPNLHTLPPGPHGFHLHQNASCGKNGLAAGGHLDPKKTSTHLGPYKTGHLGDLPVLYVNAEGKSLTTLIAPHLSLDDIKGHSIMIHAGGDNYTDNPTLGGGGPRIACGVIR